ncbi:p21-activated protein kinase-interacting protein 1-like [Zerene cesonia]|uniref:p21-activated protein kinase-interacting protein 1-like n=1 Tax=Zerene cesonia TaxID=33412 RepID=UPI0018E5A468|nr:p21-activated protein kinase-interacting protein 1-like [Zerene cesonia]
MDELIVGTYEGFLLGYSIQPEEEATKLKQTFATHSHTASVRCISTAGKFLASGGTDDKVVVIDLITRKEHTVLMNHDGSINAVAFTHGGTHLLTGSDDGSIIVTRTGNWQIEKVWKKAHGGQPVTAVAVHPSDKLVLSLGGDRTLRTWNLIKGRPAFTINLASKGITLPTEIKFSPGGDRFSLVSQQTVDIWKISEAGLEKRITCNSKPITVQWSSDEQVFVGLENGNILSVSVSETQALTYPAHRQRVKCVHFENNMLYSASSAGEIKTWSVDDKILREICCANAACRITCVALNRQNHLIKKEETDEENDNEKEEVENEDSNSEESNNEDTPTPPKRKIGAFVTISYGDEEDNKNDHQPPAKKAKKKRKNKKSKNKNTG